ncbi:MAG: SusC/RagA family TonB-linked outer membrane protein [Bacteroidota bacterium]
MRNFYLSRISQLLLAITFLLGLPFTSYSQSIIGKVIDENSGQALAGVSIMVKGTQRGILSNRKGKFGIQAKEGETLRISYYSYEIAEVVLGKKSKIEVSLRKDPAFNDVIGAYRSEPFDMIGVSPSIVSGDDLNKDIASSFLQKLEGRFAGLMSSTSGEVAAPTSIRIRGIGSFHNNDPLYIIDGLPVEDDFLHQLNPQDIASVRVLKDAAASSIYGMRASNGVILVETKMAKETGIQVDYNSYLGVQNPINRYNLIQDPATYSEAVWRSYEPTNRSIPEGVPYAAGRGVVPEYYYHWQSNGYPGTSGVEEGSYAYPENLIMQSQAGGTDWWSELFRAAPITEHQLSISGSGVKHRFYLSSSYLNQSGTMLHTQLERATIRANTRFKLGRLTVGENIHFAHINQVGMPGLNQSEQSSLSHILKAQSIIPVYDVSGENFAGAKSYGLGIASNPVALQTRNKDNGQSSYHFMGNVFAELRLTQGFSAKTVLGAQISTDRMGRFSFPTWENLEPNTQSSFEEVWRHRMDWVWTNSLNYHKVFNKSHKLELLGGIEALKESQRSIGGGLDNFLFNSPDVWYLQNHLGNPDSRRLQSEGQKHAMLSQFVKLDYVLQNKYLISAIARRDASSRFSSSSFGLFPAYSLGWKVSRERFMRKIKWIDDFNLRFGWGKTGKASFPFENRLGVFASDPAFSNYDIRGNGNLASGLALNQRGQEGVLWEAYESSNMGLDASLFKGKLNLGLDFFERRSDNILLQTEAPGTQGLAGALYQNTGAIENKGFEVFLNYQYKLDQENYVLIEAVLGHVKNKILSLGGGREHMELEGEELWIGQSGINQVGHAIGSFYGFTADGIFSSQEEVSAHAQQAGAAPGRLRFKDINGDGVINHEDRGIIGSPWPKYTAGLTLKSQLGNWDASLALNASLGNKVFNFTKVYQVFHVFDANLRADILDRAWHPDLNPEGDLPILDRTDTYSPQPSSFYLENASYLRVRHLQIGYTFPKSYGFDTLRLYFQLQNPISLTKYTGLDPAISNFQTRGNGDQWAGYDFANYPSSKTALLGVNISF